VAFPVKQLADGKFYHDENYADQVECGFSVLPVVVGMDLHGAYIDDSVTVLTKPTNGTRPGGIK
jgi:hypothetical protein